MATEKIVRIGGASGFWGDSQVAAPQLVASGRIDYLVFDYLAETTMAILAAARLKHPELGYATDFVDVAMGPVLGEIAARGIKVVSNAGGIHPRACAAALEAQIAAAGLTLTVAVVEGDDVGALVPALAARGVRDMYDGAPLPARITSANAYLGAAPIAAALAAGADIVVTGRVVDSALVLGPLMHEFGWRADDFDRLAAGSLAGHIVECGCQATGGLFTDWESVPDWPNIGYPIAECRADGTFDITKPAGTGGLIARAAVAEQLLYEIGDPGAYVLPDVICDFRDVVIEQVDAERVRVSGARGLAPTDAYKVSATALQGHRCAGTLVIVGIDAVAKAERTGAAIIERTTKLVKAAGFADFTATHVEVIGAETSYGPHSRTRASREVMLRVVADHADRRALEIFAREIAPAGTSWSPGTTGPGGGRPSVSSLIRPFSFLLDKREAPASWTLRGVRSAVPVEIFGGTVPAPNPGDGAPRAPASHDGEATTTVPLIRLAWARSGDKGDLSNVGVIARRAEWLPLLWRELGTERVGAYLAHLVRGKVERFHLPGIDAINFVLHEALDGGGAASPRLDPLGKGMAQILLDMPIEVPCSLAIRVPGELVTSPDCGGDLRS
ncbi:MAG: acyclic terpene utilization AtuA family protein [Caldimonas sp.]